MFEGLDDGMDGYHAIHNLIEMGQTCLQEEFHEEAELVLNFAMALAETHPLGNVHGLDAMREPLKTSGWMALSQLYETTGRYAEAEEGACEDVPDWTFDGDSWFGRSNESDNGIAQPAAVHSTS